MEWIYPLLLIGLPSFGPVPCVLGSKLGMKGLHAVALSVLCATTIGATAMVLVVLDGGTFLVDLPLGPHEAPAFNVDVLASITVLLSSSLCLCAAMVSRAYGAMDGHGTRYASALLILCASLNGIFLSADLLLLIVFWELMVLCSYLLVVHSASNKALKAGRRYFIMAQTGAVMLVISAAIAIGETGTSSMVGSVFLGGKLGIFALFAFLGFAVDAAVVPLHFWLPGAHSESPTPISALLSGIVVKTGIYGIARFFFILYGLPSNWAGIIVPLGLLSALVGGFLAVFQMDGKRLIAMSTVSQVGLMVMALGSGITQGSAGGIYHLLNHSVFKALLFLTAGWVMHSAGTRNLREAGERVGRSSRRLLPLYVVGLLSISGIPPFNGFYSKAIIVKSVNAQFPAYALLSGLVGALTLLSFMKLGWYLFLRNRAGGNGSSTPPPSVIVVCSALALVCLLQGVLAPQMLALTDLGLGVTGADTPVPSLLKPSPLTIVGYLGILVAILIWAGKSAVYAMFTSGRLGFVGAVARRELYFESAYLSLSRAGHAASDLASRVSSGSIRDYVAYIIIAWAAGLALELGGTLT